MSTTDIRNRFSSLSITLHWLMVLLISVVYATILLRENYPKGTDIREGLKTWHFILGLTVLALAIIRLLARLSQRTPPITPEPPSWQTLLANATHLALYAFMLAMPYLNGNRVRMGSTWKWKDSSVKVMAAKNRPRSLTRS